MNIINRVCIISTDLIISGKHTIFTNGQGCMFGNSNINRIGTGSFTADVNRTAYSQTPLALHRNIFSNIDFAVLT